MKKKKPRQCKFPGCKVTLNSYNKGRFCYYHNEVLIQNSVIYICGRFYFLNIQGSSTAKRILLNPIQVSRLRPIKSEDEVLVDGKE